MIKAKLTCLSVNRFVKREIVTFGTRKGTQNPFNVPGTESPIPFTINDPAHFGQFEPGQDFELSLAVDSAPAA